MGLFEDFYGDLFDGHQSQESKEYQTEYSIGRDQGLAGEGDLEVFGHEAFGWMIPGTKQHQSRVAGIRQGHQDSAAAETDEREASAADSDDDETYAADHDIYEDDDELYIDEDEDAELLPKHTGNNGATITKCRRSFYWDGKLLLEREYNEDDPSFYSEEGECAFLLEALIGAVAVDEAEDQYDEDEEEDDCVE